MLVQEEMIGRVRRLCCEDERVRAALMYGSFSKGSGDAYSDIEFFIFLEDDRYETVDAENWVAQGRVSF
jgi:lincosamide nucleotidyltransferase